MAQPATLSELRQFLHERLAAGRREYFGKVREAWSQAADEYFWDESQQAWRLQALRRHGVCPGMHRVLDLASGCGQFVLLALREGYDCHGVEPDAWRKAFVERKIELSGHPAAWKERFHQGTGESLPFADDSFDYVSSFQTLEHVNNPRKVIAEMVRITRVGGGIHLMCPDYRSTFEAHYQLPWLPLFPKSAASVYLRLLGRPTKGLETIQYTTRPRILSWIAEAEIDRYFLVSDEDQVAFGNALRRRRLPNVPLAYWLWSLWKLAGSLARREISVNLFLRIARK
jgi:ubiquinone/menaquinone biosynthesis C-methylase UbiE